MPWWFLLTACADAAPPRYLALGDSFTIGTGSSPAEAFPARLAARWSCPVEVRNPAVNGYATSDLLAMELGGVGAFSPTVVTLAIGANDLVRGSTVEGYRAQIGRIYDALAEQGVPASRVVALPQPDWARSPTGATFGDPAALHTQIVSFNGAFHAVSTERGATWADLFPLMERQARDGMWAADGLHPSASAHDAWADALIKLVPDPCR